MAMKECSDQSETAYIKQKMKENEVMQKYENTGTGVSVAAGRRRRCLDDVQPTEYRLNELKKLYLDIPRLRDGNKWSLGKRNIFHWGVILR